MQVFELVVLFGQAQVVNTDGTYSILQTLGMYVKFKLGSYKYEIEILAPTGKIIEFEKEYVKK